MGPVLRCKLRVSEVLRSLDAGGNVTQEQVKLTAVYSNDPSNVNAEWSKWTPAANFQVYINNPSAFGALGKDHEFYVDFTPANVE